VATVKEKSNPLKTTKKKKAQKNGSQRHRSKRLEGHKGRCSAYCRKEKKHAGSSGAEEKGEAYGRKLCDAGRGDRAPPQLSEKRRKRATAQQKPKELFFRRNEKKTKEGRKMANQPASNCSKKEKRRGTPMKRGGKRSPDFALDTWSTVLEGKGALLLQKNYRIKTLPL